MPSQTPQPNVDPIDDLAAQFKRYHQRITALERASTSGAPATAVTPASGRNLLDNGQGRISQRVGNGNGQPVVANTTVYISDRWQYAQGIGAIGNMTAYGNYPATFPGSTTQSHMLVQNGATGFKTPLLAGDYCKFRQGIEGYRLLPLRWGTANAKPATFTFAYTSNTRASTVIVTMLLANSTSISRSVDIPVGGGIFTVTFPANTTTTPAYNNTVQAWLDIWIAAGSTYNNGNPASLATTWGSAATGTIAAGCTNVWDRANQQVNFVQAQLEAGDVSTPYEDVTYDAELARCQRYAYFPTCDPDVGADGHLGWAFAASATQAYGFIPLPVTMRAVPTALFNAVANAIRIYDYGAFIASSTAVSILAGHTTRNIVGISATFASGLTTGRAYAIIRLQNTGNLGILAEI